MYSYETFKVKTPDLNITFLYSNDSIYQLLQELDRLLLEEFNCVCPIQTKKKDKQFCEIQHFTFEQKIKFKTSYHGIY